MFDMNFRREGEAVGYLVLYLWFECKAVSPGLCAYLLLFYAQ